MSQPASSRRTPVTYAPPAEAAAAAAAAAAREGAAGGDDPVSRALVAGAERAVVHRLAVSLWREGWVEAQPQPGAADPVAVVLMYQGKPLLRGRGLHPLGFGRYVPVGMGDGGRTLGWALADGLGDWVEAPTVPEVLAQLGWGSDPIAGELDDSIANLVLTLARSAQERMQLRQAGVDTLEAWLATREDADDARRALEGCVPLGHTLHPCTKTRLGMSMSESMRYGPETVLMPVPLRFVAVHRRVLQRSGEPLEPLLARLWPNLAAAAAARLGKLPPEAGVVAADYEVLPVHPWQHEHRLADTFGDLLKSGAMIDLRLVADAHPQLAVRTVEPCGPVRDLRSSRVVAPMRRGPAAVHLKLAMDVQTTSAQRTISPQSVHNGPYLSQLLPQAIGDTPGLQLCRELGAAGLDPGAVPDGVKRARQLAVIVRENPTAGVTEAHAASVGTSDIQPSQVPWLMAALTATAPFSSRSLLTEVLAQHHLAHPEGVAAFFTKLCHIVLAAVLPPVARAGVALEAHGQNTWLRLDSDGMPAGIIIRDLGGVRLYAPRLAQALRAAPAAPADPSEHAPVQLYTNSAPDAPDMDEVIRKASHCVLQTLLVDVIAALQRDFPDALPNPWKVVRQALEAALTPEQAGLEGPQVAQALLAPQAQAKCLLRMRRTGAYNQYLLHPVPNPLADAAAVL